VKLPEAALPAALSPGVAGCSIPDCGVAVPQVSCVVSQRDEVGDTLAGIGPGFTALKSGELDRP